MLFAAEEHIIVLATMRENFQHGGHEPDVVISHRLTYQDRVKILDRFRT